ncbi:hypothetical protein FRC07_000583 [Ceratobasidium sp. 392]|nr:hypothetical protein FRC07_000583 [Ceratobasidium sp. 392]
MSLSATRSRRPNAGNRWAEALAAAQLENGDAPDPDAEAPGEEFVGREEEDVFESDFESTDEEEYAKEGIADEEKQVMLEERAERRAARAKAAKSVAAPVQRMLERATKGEPVKKKRKVVVKTKSEKGAAKSGGDIVMWDATRQSRRASTVKHKALVRERLEDAEKRRAHAVKRPRKATVTKTQDELIAEALELEEKNTKSLKEFLVKEEEKRAAARRVVRMKIEGPLVRWVSRAEDVRVRVEGAAGNGAGTANAATATTAPHLPSNSAATEYPGAYNGSTLPARNGSSQQLARSPLSQSIIPLPQPQTDTVPAQSVMSNPIPKPEAKTSTSQQLARSPLSQSILPLPQPSADSAPAPGSVPNPTPKPEPESSTSASAVAAPSHPARAAATPAPSTSGKRMQVYVEIPRRPISSSQRLARAASVQPVPSISISEPSSQSPRGVSSSQPVPSSQPMVRAPSLSRSFSGRSAKSTSPVDSLNPNRPNAIRQASVSSTSSHKSRMIMYVELPAPKSIKAGASRANTPEVREATPKPPASPRVDRDIFPPGGPNFAIVLPTRRPSTTTTTVHKRERQARNYIVVELSGKERNSFGARMRAVFGGHVDWSKVLVEAAKPNDTRTKPVCAITGLNAPYRDPRTGIPYANAYAYKTLTRLLQHEFVWSQEKGCYVGDEGKNAAKGVPWNWAAAATGRS